jgi:hypothetical protein
MSGKRSSGQDGRIKETNTMEQTSTLSLRRQNFMLAVRAEMGWPQFAPANDCIAFCSGRPMDFEVGSEMAHIVTMERKDAVYAGWASVSATEPTFAIVYRELLSVDVIDRVVPYAEHQDSPIVFVSTTADEFFAVDRRGSLLRLQGKPKNIGKGRKLAMKRIKSAAAASERTLLESNRLIPHGGDWIAPQPANDVIVKFG